MSAACSVAERRDVRVASLRYWDAAGTFAGAVCEFAGHALPGNQRALQTAAGDILAWRSPSETLLLRTAGSDFTDVTTRTAAANDGCLVEQTGGIAVLVASGAGVGELLSRLGGGVSPAAGQSRICRLADLSVASLCLRAGETWLLVERVYAEHLRGWIDATLQDGTMTQA